MKFRSQIIISIVVVFTIFVAACSSNTPTSSPTNPTSAPSVSTQSTNAPAATQASNTVAPTATSVISAQSTTAATSAASASPTATTVSTPAAPQSGTGALDFIAAAMQAEFSAKSFRQTSVTTNETGGTTTTIIEYVSPDRMHVSRTGVDTTSGETIVIKGQGTWTKTNGQWAKSPIDLSSMLFSMFDPKNIEQLRSSMEIGSLQLVGADVIGTTPTLVYQYNESIKGAGAGGGPLNGTYKVWVGATDHRVYKLEGDTDSITKPGAKVHTSITTEYDVSIQIQPPI